MIISINQPNYLPWPGFYERIANSDIHIVLDHVQFEKNSLTNRNKIKTDQGWSWLTVPIESKGKFGNMAINQVKISNLTNWQRKHWNSISLYYSKAPYFKDHAPFFEYLYKENWDSLFLMNQTINIYILNYLSIGTKIILSSDLIGTGAKSDLILDLCQKVKASVYLSGSNGVNYLDLDKFTNNGINVRFQNYIYPCYKQLYGEFIPNLSIVDLLFNEGHNSKSILLNNESKQCRRQY